MMNDHMYFLKTFPLHLDGNEPRQDPVDYERHFRSYFEKDLANNCKSKSDRTAAGTNQDKLVGMMQDSFPQGGVLASRFWFFKK